MKGWKEKQQKRRLNSMLKIHFNTGVHQPNTITVEGTLKDDIMEIIDIYVQENKETFRIYTYEQAFAIYEDFPLFNQYFIPINGGEYYIDSINYIEEI